MCVFPNDKLGKQLYAFTHGRQVVEGLHRYVGLIADTVDIDDDLRRVFFNQFAGQSADHVCRILKCRVQNAV